MRRILLVTLILATSIGARCAEAATLTLKARAPQFSDDGLPGCSSAPVLVPRGANDPVTVHYRVTGSAVTLEDSVATITGGLIQRTLTVPPGTYAIRWWASDAGGVGCDTTQTKVATAPPAKVSALP